MISRMRRPHTEPRSTPRRLAAMVPVVAALLLAMTSPALAQDAALDGPDSTDAEYEYDYDVDTDPAAIDDFRDRLEPHGTWLDDPTYGTVWVPDVVVVGEDFQPYRTAGRWGVTDAGDWVWMSDYDWGYIPFHYGRWIWIPARGWAWVPGRVYAPAWVVWRTGEPGYDYIGWAPAPPTYVWFGGAAVGFYATVTLPWWYCPSAYFFSPGWGVYVVHDPVRVRHIHAHTHVHHHHGHGHHGHAKASAGGHQKAKPSSGGHGKATGSTASNPKAAGKVQNPSGAFGQKARSKSSNDYAFHQIPRAPAFDEARIPESSRPKKRVAPDKRAVALRDSAPKVGRGGTTRTRVSSRGAKSSPSASRASRASTKTAPSTRRIRRRGDGSFTVVPPVTRSNARSAGERRLPPRDRGLRTSRATRSPSTTRSPSSYQPSTRYRGSPRATPSARRTSTQRAPSPKRSRASRSTPTRSYRPPATRSRSSRSTVRRSSPSRSAVKRSSSRSSSRSRSSSGSRSRSSSRSRSKSRR